jgi:hypothetical protein
MSDDRYKSRKQKIRHGGNQKSGTNHRKIKPRNTVDVYKGDRKAA